MSKSHEDIWDEWKDLVNMTKSELEKFLKTDESKEVGQKSGGGDSTGHQSCRRNVKLLDTNNCDRNDDDYAHPGKVVGYIKRHKAQGGPDEDMEHSAWRYSLMNWGHDPKKA